MSEYAPDGRHPLRLIAGSGRSGTTWVLDALAEANRLRPVFEPLHTDTSTTGRSFGYAYLARDAECPELEALFSAAARGSLSTIWTDYRIKPDRLSPRLRYLRSAAELKALAHRWKSFAGRFRDYRERRARRETLTKCIRANLLLDWICARFDARILFLMRHPGAAVESRLRFTEHWDPFPLLERYRADAGLMGGPLAGQAARLHGDFTRIEALTAIWCIENIVPAGQAAANGYIVAFYEEMLRSPQTEWLRIAEGLQLQGVPSAGVLERPSQQAAVLLQQDSEADDYAKSYGKWRARLMPDEARQVQSILELFDVGFYHVSELHPDTGAFTRRYLTNVGSRPHAPALQIP